MMDQNEYRLLCDTLEKYHVHTERIAPLDIQRALVDADLLTLFGKAAEHTFLGQAGKELAPGTMYKLTDRFGLCYIYFLSDVHEVLLIGPYLTASPTKGAVLELGEKNGLTPKSQRHLEEYYSAIPVLQQGNPLLLLINTFCEHTFKSASFAVIDTESEHKIPASPIREPAHSDHFDDVLVSMKTIENRYSFENELMQAVTLGQIHKESMLQASFSDLAFEKRTTDPLRNAKNYCVIMNTLLRKAAEAGGVHPIYLDSVSTGFALDIEQLPSLLQISQLMRDMFRTYCRLVRKHTTNKFSPVVQKTVLLIDSDLSANLSLQSLSTVQGISPPYLSAVFKKETGTTVSSYIRERRMKHAIHLLSTTHLQIQTVALHCGIMDVQYFSKIFKRHTGKTPKEYREDIKKTQN